MLTKNFGILLFWTLVGAIAGFIGSHINIAFLAPVKGTPSFWNVGIGSISSAVAFLGCSWEILRVHPANRKLGLIK